MENTINSTLQEWMLTMFSGIGLTFIVTQSRLFKWLQKIYLFQCPMCFGFWAGCLVRFAKIQMLQLDIIMYGFMCSLFSYILYLVIYPLMKKYD